MKQQKNTTVEVKVEAMTAKGRTAECVNLVERADGGLVPCVAARVVADGALTPLHEHLHPSGERTMVMYAKTGSGGYEIVTETGGEKRVAGVMTAEPRCALSRDDGVIVMSRNGRRRLMYDRESGWRMEESAAPEMAVVRTEKQGELSAWTESVEVKEYAGGRLPTSAVGKLSKSLTAAYSELCGSAMTAGLWVQPSLMEVRYLDGEGRCVAKSAPILAAPNGWQCVAPLTAELTAEGSGVVIPEMRLTAQTYWLAIDVPAGLVAAGVASVELVETPSLHPVDFSGEAPTRVAKRDGVLHLTTAVPGVTEMMASKESVRKEKLAELASVEGCFSCRVVMLDATAVEGKTVTVKRVGGMTAKEETRSAEAMVGGREMTTSDWSARILKSEEFVAESVGRSGGAVLWGNLRIAPTGAKHAEGWTCEYSGTKRGWRGAVVAEYAGGGRMVERIASKGRVPLSLMPMLTIEDRRVSKLTVYVEDEDGEKRMATVAMTPDRLGADRATYVADGLKPIALSAFVGEIPTETEREMAEYADVVAYASATEPMRLLSATKSGAGRVEAIVAGGRGSSLDMNRVRFWCVARGGIVSVNANQKTGSVTAVLADNRGATSGAAVADTPYGMMVATGNEIVAASGNGCKTVLNNIAVEHVCWSAREQGLRMTDGVGNTKLMVLPSKKISERLMPVLPERMFRTATGVMISSDTALMAVDEESEEREKMVVWSAEADVPDGRSVAWLKVDMAASEMNGDVTLSLNDGAGSEYGSMLMKLTVAGAVNSPIYASVAAPMRRRAVVRVSGRVSEDFVLRKVEMGVRGKMKGER